MPTTDRFDISLIQMQVTPRKQENLALAEKHLRQAAPGAGLVVLPEVFNVSYEVADWTAVAEPVPGGQTCDFLSDMARTLDVYLVGGSIAELHDGRVFNTATLWSPTGKLLLTHRKVHLFDVDIPGGITFTESDFLAPGDAVSVVNTDLGPIGLAICFDIRFPEQLRLTTLAGAELIVLPAAFNTTTGPAHWEVNLRCRAMENTVYLAGCSAAAHPEVTYPAWGHSMLVDPYGEIIARTQRAPDIIRGTFDRERLTAVRQALPFLTARRPDVYGRAWLEPSKR